nr:hypothetical protein [Tanacetum cinerariifolium]
MQDDFINQIRNFMQNFHDGLLILPLGEDKEHEVTTDTELSSTEDIQPLPVQEPPQNSDIRQLIREDCCVEDPEKQKQKQKIEDTMFELIKIFQEKEFLCIHNDVDDLIESALNSKLLLVNSNSQHLDKKEREVKNVVEQPIERENCKLEHLLSMGYEHLSITPETESDEVTESNAENLLPIPSECEVALEDKRECVYDDDFEDVEYVEASLPDPEIVSVEEENVVQQEEEEVDFEDISQIQDVVLQFKTFCDHTEETRSGNTTHANDSLPEYDSFCFEIEPDQERLIYLVKNDIPDDSSNDPILEEVDLFLSDNLIPPGIENVADDPEGDIRFLEELIIDNSILSHELSDSNFEDNPSMPRPPPKPPDTETDAGEEILVVMNDKDEDGYSSFIFVIFAKMFSLLFAEREDTIFDPGLFPRD